MESIVIASLVGVLVFLGLMGYETYKERKKDNI